MTVSPLRKQIQQKIEKLPDDVLREVADFMSFVMAHRRYEGEIEDWDDETWQQMALEQFFREEDEIEYSFDDGSLNTVN